MQSLPSEWTRLVYRNAWGCEYWELPGLGRGADPRNRVELPPVVRVRWPSGVETAEWVGHEPRTISRVLARSDTLENPSEHVGSRESGPLLETLSVEHEGVRMNVSLDCVEVRAETRPLAVVFAVFEGDRVLGIVRKVVSLPAGEIEEGERPEQAAVRVAREEGLVIRLKGTPFVGLLGLRIAYVYLADLVGDPLLASEVGWTTREEIETAPHCGDFSRRAFRHLLRHA